LPPGGERKGAGRPKGSKNKPKGILLSPANFDNEEFCVRVLNRIGEGPPLEIKNVEDYLLTLLYSKDIQTRSYNFNRTLDRVLGRPPQGILIADSRSAIVDPDERIRQLFAIAESRLGGSSKPP
jgi:hypothetical protein